MSGAAVLVLRPEPAATATADRLRAIGCAPFVLPLFEVQPLSWEAPDTAGFDALALSSANALRHGGAELAKLTNLPVYAVGEATAEAARAAGFDVAGVGSGGISGLEPLLLRDSRRSVLRLVGYDYMDFAPPGMQVETIRIYAARAAKVDAGRIAELPIGTAVLLYSVRAAERFAELVGEADMPRAHFRLFAISSLVARAAGRGWAASIAAPVASEASLLSLLQNMLEADASTGRQGKT